MLLCSNIKAQHLSLEWKLQIKYTNFSPSRVQRNVSTQHVGLNFWSFNMLTWGVTEYMGQCYIIRIQKKISVLP